MTHSLFKWLCTIPNGLSVAQKTFKQPFCALKDSPPAHITPNGLFVAKMAYSLHKQLITSLTCRWCHHSVAHLWVHEHCINPTTDNTNSLTMWIISSILSLTCTLTVSRTKGRFSDHHHLSADDADSLTLPLLLVYSTLYLITCIHSNHLNYLAIIKQPDTPLTYSWHY